MKKLLSLLVLSAIGVASAASAAPRAQDWKPQRSLATVEDFQALKAGDSVAQVCKMCDSVSMKKTKSHKSIDRGPGTPHRGH